MKLLMPIASTALLISGSQALSSSSIEGCPPLLPRLSPPKGVHDLRIDDIKVVAGLGDSIMAGFVARGIQDDNFFSPNTTTEYRGLSWAVGGDEDELTIPNFIKHYSPNVRGASVGMHGREFCSGYLCPPKQYQPAKDRLNAAQTGATVINLEHEIDYLLTSLREIPGIDYENDWKLITLQLGSNDQCLACITDVLHLSSVEEFGREVDVAIDRIRTHVPRVLINIGSVFNVTNIYEASNGQSYCKAFLLSDLILGEIVCPCSATTEGRNLMSIAAAGYAAQLYRVYEKYKGMEGDDFGIMYTPGNFNLGEWPVQAFSNADCFHPAVPGHQFVAKSVWNSMFKPLAERFVAMPWNPDEIHCPDNTDRLRLE